MLLGLLWRLLGWVVAVRLVYGWLLLVWLLHRDCGGWDTGLLVFGLLSIRDDATVGRCAGSGVVVVGVGVDAVVAMA